eukprot:Nk52_evm25s2474 gene=Nk52_evmTU25s2474
MKKRRVIVDCDPGCDDAISILYALHSPRLCVEAVTCVEGNVDLKQVCTNARKILGMYKNTCPDANLPPVFCGSTPLTRGVRDQGNLYTWPGHGKQGLGLFVDENGAGTLAEADVQMSSEPAASAISRIARGVCAKGEGQTGSKISLHSSKQPGLSDGRGVEEKEKVSLVCLGPLSNIALSLKLDVDLPQYIDKIHIMGGSIHGKGNASLSAEFNFHHDPEAVNVVLNSFDADQLVIVPWEACLGASLQWKEYDDIFRNEQTKDAGIVQNMRNVLHEYETFCRNKIPADKYNAFVCCDAYAMFEAAGVFEGNAGDGNVAKRKGSALELESGEEKPRKIYMEIDTSPRGLCRGTVVYDWYNKSAKEANATVIMHINHRLFRNELLCFVQNIALDEIYRKARSGRAEASSKKRKVPAEPTTKGHKAALFTDDL